MPRPNRIEAKRRELLPIVARAFSELGYHRATTAELARRCGVRENILYRLWADKKAMFIASIQFVYDLAVRIWDEQATRRSGRFSVHDLLAYEAEHLGEFGHYRIVFSGLSETSDPDIRAALVRMYRNFHAYIRRRIRARHEAEGGAGPVDAGVAAWALIGLGTVSTIAREMELMSPRSRKAVLGKVGGLFLGPRSTGQ